MITKIANQDLGYLQWYTKLELQMHGLPIRTLVCITRKEVHTIRSHCLRSLTWIKKSIWSRDCYSSQINAKPEWNLSKLKFFDELFLRKFKNLAKKLSDFDKNFIKIRQFFGQTFVVEREGVEWRTKFLLQNFLFWKKIRWYKFEISHCVSSKVGF